MEVKDNMVPYAGSEKFRFRDAADSREKMTAYIRQNFAHILGDDVKLLNLPNGLEILQAKVRTQLALSGIDASRKAVQAA